MEQVSFSSLVCSSFLAVAVAAAAAVAFSMLAMVQAKHLHRHTNHPLLSRSLIASKYFDCGNHWSRKKTRWMTMMNPMWSRYHHRYCKGLGLAGSSLFYMLRLVADSSKDALSFSH